MGYLPIVEYILTKLDNVDFDEYLNLACMNGHLSLAKFMIEKGANDF